MAETEKRELPVKLTDKDRELRLFRIVVIEKDVGQLKDEIKERNAAKKKLEEERTKITEEVDAGEATQFVDVQEVFDHSKQVCRVIRLDNQTVVEERAMTTDELQTKIPGA